MTTVTEVAVLASAPSHLRQSVAPIRRRAHWRMAAWVGLMTFVVASAAARRLDIDGLYTLYSGRAVAAGLPHHEQFTTMAQRAWVDQQWLGQWLFYRVYALGGYAGVVILGGMLIAAAAVILVVLMMRRGARPGVAAAWTGAAVTVLLSTSVVRTQAFAFPLFAAVLLVVLAHDVSWRRQLVVVPLLILWANLHGSVLLGAALAAACFGWSAIVAPVSRLARVRTLAIAVACAATPLATPYGLSIVHYYTSLIGNPTLRAAAAEWRPAAVSDVASWPYFGLLLCAGVALALGCWRRRRIPVAELVLVAGFAALGLYAVRYMFWGAMLIAVVAASMAPSTRRRSLPLPSALAWTLFAAIAAAAAISPFTVRDSSYLAAMPLRLAAVAATTVDENIGDPILTDQRTSAALLWLHADVDGRVAFDIRFEQYAPATLARYFAFLRGAAPDLACRYPIIAVSHTERPALAASVLADPAWKKVYATRDGVVAVRATSCQPAAGTASGAAPEARRAASAATASSANALAP